MDPQKERLRQTVSTRAPARGRSSPAAVRSLRGWGKSSSYDVESARQSEPPRQRERRDESRGAITGRVKLFRDQRLGRRRDSARSRAGRVRQGRGRSSSTCAREASAERRSTPSGNAGHASARALNDGVSIPTASGPIESARVVSSVTSRIDGRGEVPPVRFDGVSHRKRRKRERQRRERGERSDCASSRLVLTRRTGHVLSPLHYNRRHAELHLVRPDGDRAHRGHLHRQRGRADESIGRLGEDRRRDLPRPRRHHDALARHHARRGAGRPGGDAQPMLRPISRLLFPEVPPIIRRSGRW